MYAYVCVEKHSLIEEVFVEILQELDPALLTDDLLEWLVLVPDEPRHVDLLLSGDAHEYLVFSEHVLRRFHLVNLKTAPFLLLFGAHGLVPPDCILEITLQLSIFGQVAVL